MILLYKRCDVYPSVIIGFDERDEGFELWWSSEVWTCYPDTGWYNTSSLGGKPSLTRKQVQYIFDHYIENDHFEKEDLNL